jgi:hypothetical protein
MPFLQLGAVTVSVAEGTFTSEPEAIGDTARAVSGRLRSALSGYKYTHTFTTIPLTASEAASLIALFGTVVSATGDRFPSARNVLVQPGNDETLMIQHSSGFQNAARQLEIELVEQ